MSPAVEDSGEGGMSYGVDATAAEQFQESSVPPSFSRTRFVNCHADYE